MRALLLLAVLALPGCLAPGPSPVVPAAAPEAASAPAPAEPQVIVDLDSQGGVPPASELDVLCAFGGGVPLKRTGERILQGVAELVATVTVPATSTGVQLGYKVDDGDVTWLPVAAPGQATTFRIPVPEGAHEADRPRWAFGQQHNLSPAPQDCYTGGSVDGWAIRVETA